MGRPRFNPTAEQYRMVKSLAAYGMRQSEIAAMLELRSEKTLRKHFRSALDRGAAEANSQVAQSLYRLATSGKSAAAAIFWLKCRAGWREQKEFDRSAIPPPPFVVGAVKENQ